jgi:arginine N-succinyltransferase
MMRSRGAMCVRPAAAADLDALLALAREAGSGMTTFKADRPMLARRLDVACASFAGQASQAEADYVFVLEDMDNGRVAGISAIKGAVGLDEAFYNYRIDTVVHSSAELGLFTRLQLLHLSNDMTGATELCSLFLHPDYRSGNNGKLLSKARLLFLAQFPQAAGARVFAEMRGFQDEDGRAPFYEALGRHFFKIGFEQADDLTACGRKAFIAELMPRQPLYACYLPAAARGAIGQVHRNTVPARRLLEQEGLHHQGLIDIFDGGAVLEARLGDLRVMRDSVLAAVAPGAAAPDAPPGLACNLEREGFRVVEHRFAAGGACSLDAGQRAMLGVAPGAGVRHYPLVPLSPSIQAEAGKP